MTEKEIDAMEAGRELDALIAEKVMGWQLITGKEQVAEFQRLGKLDDGLGARLHYQGLWVFDGKSVACDECGTVPHYSTDIGAAWLVVEKFQQQDKLHMFAEACPVCDSTPWSWCGYSAAEMALVICKSALKAVLTLNCAACQKPIPLYALIKEYEWYFCRDCQHTIAMTDIQVRGRDRRGIFERAVADCHKITTTEAGEPATETG